jgi:hypothetical protein
MYAAEPWLPVWTPMEKTLTAEYRSLPGGASDPRTTAGALPRVACLLQDHAVFAVRRRRGVTIADKH